MADNAPLKNCEKNSVSRLGSDRIEQTHELIVKSNFLNNSEKLKLLLSEYPRKTARYLVQSLAKRKNHLYLNN
jgi:hypothetical protein